jgi:cytosine/uracil/thiamine/allantoin permease
MTTKAYRSSAATLVDTPFYDIEKLEKKTDTQTSEESGRPLGLFLFIVGFIFPLTWILGIILCYQKGIHHSKKWFIANGVATILLLIGLAIWLVVILTNGSATSYVGQPELNFKTATNSFKQ